MKVFLTWIIGLVASFFFAWFVSFLFLDSLLIYQWDPSVQSYVLAPDNAIRRRSEGWGLTSIGTHGVIRYSDIGLVHSGKVAFWGDSFVEALQVNDSDKMDFVFTRLCAENGFKNVVGFSRGLSGDNVATYYFNIPRYEKIIHPIVAHVIIIAEITDILPTREKSRHMFVSEPELRLIEDNYTLPYQGLKRLMRKYELTFAWNIIRSIMFETSLRFTLQTQENPWRGFGPQGIQADLPPIEAWSFLLDKYQGITDKPIIFVYCPSIPSPANGEVTFTDPYAHFMSAFAQVCAIHSMGFIDMTPDFSGLYKQTRTFPRGFCNTRVGEGHLNPEGHRLVAQEVFRYLREKLD